MGSYGKKTRHPGFDAGNHWVECDVCGFIIRSRDAKLTWDNKVVCPEDFETRHPQDFVRGRADEEAAKGLVRPEKTDGVAPATACTTRSAIAGDAIAGCALAGYNPDTTPSGTFTNSL
jgi:hypothetical protein